MTPLTIKDIYEECKQLIKDGNGDKVVMISNDDEGNGYHYCWYSFTTATDLVDDYMIDNNIAEKKDTMVLG